MALCTVGMMLGVGRVFCFLMGQASMSSSIMPYYLNARLSPDNLKSRQYEHFMVQHCTVRHVMHIVLICKQSSFVLWEFSLELFSPLNIEGKLLQQ